MTGGCGDDEDIHDCIARLTHREKATEEGLIFGSALRLFLREQWHPLVKRFEAHIVDEANYRERQADKDMQRDRLLEDIKGILLDPEKGMVRRRNDELASKTERKHVVAIVTTVLAVGASLLAMMWHVMQILERILHNVP